MPGSQKRLANAYRHQPHDSEGTSCMAGVAIMNKLRLIARLDHYQTP
jgi:hypothetical protein